MVSFDSGYTKKQLFGQLLWGLAWIFVTACGIYLRPDPAGHGTHMQLGLPACPSTMFFDRPCPGCGLTTSFTATIHGNFAAAFQAHALGTFLYLAFTVSALACLWAYFRNTRFNTDSRRFSWALGGLLVVFFSFGALRFFMATNYNAKLPQPFVQRDQR